MKRRSTTTLLLAVPALAVALAGCNGGAAEGGSSELAEQAEADGEPRVIGTPIPEEDIAPPPPEVAELSNTFGSIFDLSEALLKAIDNNDVETMLRYRMTESEFYWIVWPELPSNRPEVGMPWDWVWRDMNQKSTNSARFIANKFQGKGLRLLRVEFDGETSTYGFYKVHRDARCIVELPDGEIQRLDLFGSVLEMNGRFKAYSLLVD